MPPKKNNTQALTVWDQELAERARTATKVLSAIGSAGNFISTRAGVLSYQGKPVPDNTMNVIVLAQVLENQWYDTEYDPNSPTSPACYAFGLDRKTMAPDPEQVENPVNPTCLGCPNKEFGTASKGKGKACGDVVRLSMIAENDLDALESAEIASIKVAYFSTLQWAAYVDLLVETYHKDFTAFVTTMKLVPDQKAQHLLKFSVAAPIEFTSEIYAALKARVAEAERTIAAPYPKFDQEEAPPAPPARRGGNGRAAAPAPARRTNVAAPARTREVVKPQNVGRVPAAVVGAAGVRVGARREVKAPKF